MDFKKLHLTNVLHHFGLKKATIQYLTRVSHWDVTLNLNVLNDLFLLKLKSPMLMPSIGNFSPQTIYYTFCQTFSLCPFWLSHMVEVEIGYCCSIQYFGLHILICLSQRYIQSCRVANFFPFSIHLKLVFILKWI